MDEDKNNIELIKGNFKTDERNRFINPVKIFKNTTNPIYKNLFKLIHTRLSGNKNDYKSFSKFNPDDLR